MTQIVHCHLFFQLLALPSLLHWLKLLFLSVQFQSHYRLSLLDLLLPSLSQERQLLPLPSTLSQVPLVYRFLQVEAGGSKPSLVPQLAICLPTHFLHLSHLHWLMLRLLSGRFFLALFWEMHLSLSVVSLACTFLERWDGLQLQHRFDTFIIPDLLKGLIVALVTKPVLKALKNHSYFN